MNFAAHTPLYIQASLTADGATFQEGEPVFISLLNPMLCCTQVIQVNLTSDDAAFQESERMFISLLNPMLRCTQIIQVNLTSDGAVLAREGEELAFTYSVNWVPTATPFHRRFERYLDYSFFEHKVGACWPCRCG